MADMFNPQANLPNPQDYLNYSRGVRDTSLGDFATNIAGVTDSGIKALDRGVTQMANDEVDQVVNDTDSQLLGIKNQGPATDPLQTEIKNQVQNLQDKKLAMDSGTIDPQHYYATITARVKDIRARYSGYGEQIDEELKRIGIDPNWQRKQIIEEGIKAQNARANAAAEFDKDQRELYEGALKDPRLIISKELRTQMVNDPQFWRDSNNMKALRGAYANTNALYSDWDAQKTQLELAATKGKAQSKALGESYGTGLMLGLHKAVINSGADKLMTELAKRAQQEFTDTGTVSPETMTQLQTSYSQFRAGAEQMRLTLKGQYADSAAMFPDDMKTQDDMFDRTMEQISQAITNKDWGALNILVNGSAAYSNSAKTDLLKDPAAATIDAIRSSGGDAAVGAVALSNPTAITDPYVKHMQAVNLGIQMKGDIKSLQDTMVKLRDAGADGKAIRDTFQKTIDLTLNKDVKDTAKINNVKALFSPENQAFWDNLDKNPNLTDADRRAYMRVMASPEMSKEVERLSTLDPRLKENYYNYLNYMFAKTNTKTANDVNDTVVNADDKTVKYNPVTNHLEVVPIVPRNTSSVARAVNGATSLLRGNSAQNAVDNFNTSVDVLTPVWQSYGLDPKELVPQLAGSLGIDLNAPKAGNPADALIAPGTKTFTGPRGAPVPTGAPAMQGGSIDLSKSPQGFAPRGAPQAVTKEGDRLQNFMQSLRFLGGPGSEQGPAGPEGNPNDRPVSGEDEKARRAEALELVREINKTENPQDKEYLRGLLKSLGPFEGKTNDQAIEDKGPNTLSGQPEPGLNDPIGDFVATTFPGTGLYEAYQSGDKMQMAKEMALLGIAAIPQERLLEGAGYIGGKLIKLLRKDNDLLTPEEKVLKEVMGKYPNGLDKEAMQEVKAKLDKLEKENPDLFRPSNKGILTSKNNIVEEGGDNVISNATFQARRSVQEMDKFANEMKSLDDSALKEIVDTPGGDNNRWLAAMKEQTDRWNVRRDLQNPTEETVKRIVEREIPGNSTAGQFSGTTGIKVTADDMKAGMNYSDKLTQVNADSFGIKLPQRAYTEPEKQVVDHLTTIKKMVDSAKSADQKKYGEAILQTAVKEARKYFGKKSIKQVK